MGINSIFPSQLEADDVVAYICREKEGSKVIISVDRDFLQLVSEECTLYDPIRKKYFDYDSFERETGYKNVEEWYTAKCLTGDKSDNVPGIPRFGSASVKKYLADPGYILDKSQQEIFKRNADIFCLDKYESLPDEKEYYREQLEVKIEASYKCFLDYCKEYSFERILSKKEDWYNLFFMKSLYNKLNDIAS
jgi:5'-3' exonuclease